MTKPCSYLWWIMTSSHFKFYSTNQLRFVIALTWHTLMQKLFFMDNNVDITLMITLMISRNQLVRYSILDTHDNSHSHCCIIRSKCKEHIPKWLHLIYWIGNKQSIDFFLSLPWVLWLLYDFHPFDLIYRTELFNIFYRFLNQHIIQWTSLAL